MRFKARFLFASLIPVALAIGLACSGPYSSPCTSFGGTCVANATQCGGSLPYGCASGVCCESDLVQGDAPPATDAVSTTSNDSSTTVTPGDDAAATDAPSSSDSSSVGTPDVSSPSDTGAPTSDTGTPTTDTGAPAVDSGVDATTSMDASSHDAAHDVATSHDTGTAHDTGTEHDTGTSHDAGMPLDAATPSDANPGCAAYAAPNTPAMCNGCTGMTCQPNGCFMGYYCHTTTNHCVKPASVVCN